MEAKRTLLTLRSGGTLEYSPTFFWQLLNIFETSINPRRLYSNMSIDPVCSYSISSIINSCTYFYQ